MVNNKTYGEGSMGEKEREKKRGEGRRGAVEPR